MNREILQKINCVVGSCEVIEKMADLPSKKPFSDEVISFLSEVSKELLKDARGKQYSDVVTFAFWIRPASVKKLKEQYAFHDNQIHLGRGVAFHIAPSNVPVNFAYSLAVGLLTGNANIVRIPSREFPQVEIIADALNHAFAQNEAFRPYVALVRYERDRDINDELSFIADTRIIWGGDKTIAELRKSPLMPRSTEITFADRYSLAVIHSDMYLAMEDRRKLAEDFYNDTFFSDQNACTSPGIVIWTGSRTDEAKELFWGLLHDLVKEKYSFQDIQGVNKLAGSYLAAVESIGARVIPHEDNRIVRVAVEHVDHKLMDLKDNCGYFFEYDCDDVMELRDLCNDRRCQTVGMIGDREWLRPLIESGIKGIDRVVSIGKTMDFDLVWDGYELVYSLTRAVAI